MEIETETKKWGNSLGIIIPNRIIKIEKIQAGQKIKVDILSKRKTTVSDVFKMIEKHPLPKTKNKKGTQEVLNEIDGELDSEVFT
ncbi:hypothetical protein KKD04_01865 [Patescibacteria group bacterium]|nr:hypothetical protein [Patescibacteria group bacterium]